jgi:hypothetical protein
MNFTSFIPANSQTLTWKCLAYRELRWQRGRKRNGNPIPEYTNGTGVGMSSHPLVLKLQRISSILIKSNSRVRVQNSTYGYGCGHAILSNRQFITSRYLIHPYVTQLSTIPTSCSRRVAAATDEPLPVDPDLCLFLRFV